MPDDDPIPLKQAAEQFGFSVSTLRAEADRGTLTIYRIGRKLYTTPSDIREMVARCKVVPKSGEFSSIPNAGASQDDISRARMALQELLASPNGSRQE